MAKSVQNKKRKDLWMSPFSAESSKITQNGPEKENLSPRKLGLDMLSFKIWLKITL